MEWFLPSVTTTSSRTWRTVVLSVAWPSPSFASARFGSCVAAQDVAGRGLCQRTTTAMAASPTNPAAPRGLLRGLCCLMAATIPTSYSWGCKRLVKKGYLLDLQSDHEIIDLCTYPQDNAWAIAWRSPVLRVLL